MIKKTLYFGNPIYLQKQQNQLKLSYPENQEKEARTIPLEDLGLLVLDHPQITITNALLQALLQNNTAVLSCNEKHLPEGLFLTLSQNQTHTEKLRAQLGASEPLRKNLWQQTIKAKIQNQRLVLDFFELPTNNLKLWESKVRSGDPDNLEGRAAAYYWAKLFNELDFKRRREGDVPNNLLNYGYAILRALVARALVASGMHPAWGIHHRNKYNAFCLADDIMEPYRPFVDYIVWEIMQAHDEEELEEMGTEIKKSLLTIPTLDVVIQDQNSPLMIGVQRTTASLMQCFEGEIRKIAYPIWQME